MEEDAKEIYQILDIGQSVEILVCVNTEWYLLNKYISSHNLMPGVS